MTVSEHRFDWVVIGAGPAGQKAAIQAAKAGQRVLVIDKARRVGGACVEHGTIPSKTLREAALDLGRIRSCEAVNVPPLSPDTQVEHLMGRKREVIASHQRYMANQLERNGTHVWHGRATFIDPYTVEVRSPSGVVTRATARFFLIATGSRPRSPTEVQVDHEHVFDSDSVLSMSYLPRSLVVLGSGVIASEYASVFSALGVDVKLVDRWPHPLGFLDRELSAGFVEAFEESGGAYCGGERVKRVAFDGHAGVDVEMESGSVLRADKVLCALGRVANVHGLGLDRIGIKLTDRGHICVDGEGRTAVRHIFAAGDVVGPPALGSTSMEQGRRAVCHAHSIPLGPTAHVVPYGVYTIPELAGVGKTEEEARDVFDNVLVGRASFAEVARGQIAGAQNGFLKLVCVPKGPDLRIVGVHALGRGASELVHIGQMAMLGGLLVETFVDNVFNFPTMAEAYRVAAFDVIGAQRAQRGVNQPMWTISNMPPGIA